MCDRIQLVSFKEVIMHEEFPELPKEDVLKYLKKCKQYSGISSDDLLHAALKWMDHNEPFSELIQQVDWKKCSQTALKSAAKHPAISQNTVAQYENFDGMMQEKEKTVAYITYDECVIVDNDAQLRILDQYDYDLDDESDFIPYRFCYTHNGYVFIKDEIFDRNIPYQARTTIVKYDAMKEEFTNLPGVGIRRPEIEFSVIHQERLYIVPWNNRDHISVYDMKAYCWSNLFIPEECRDHLSSFTGAVAGENLFFMDNRLHLFRVGKENLERIHTEIKLKHQEFKFNYNHVHFFNITAVHHWLYIFAKEYRIDKGQVYCYNTISGVWTTIPVFFRMDHRNFFSFSSVLIENKIYFAGSVDRYVSKREYFPNALYEFNPVDNTVRRSTRPCPKFAHSQMSVVDVPTKLLAPDPNAPIYTESLSVEEELACDFEGYDSGGSDSD